MSVIGVSVCLSGIVVEDDDGAHAQAGELEVLAASFMREALRYSGELPCPQLGERRDEDTHFQDNTTKVSGQ